MSAPHHEASDDDDDDYGPALPPDLLASRSGQASAVGSTTTVKKPLGPSLPPSYVPVQPTFARADDNEDSDEDCGPTPLPPGLHTLQDSTESEGVKLFREREEREAERQRQKSAVSDKPKREEWMLVPPKEMDLLSCPLHMNLCAFCWRQNSGC